MSTLRDWTNPESIDTAFYTMKDLGELAFSIPMQERDRLLNALTSAFGLKPHADIEDKTVRQIFVFSRMKLDTLKSQSEKRALFSSLVVAALDQKEAGLSGAQENTPGGRATDTSREAPRDQAAASPATPDKEQTAAPQSSSTVAQFPRRPRIRLSGDMYLFPESTVDAAPIDAGFTADLLPRPSTDDMRAVSAWLSGRPWSDAAIVIGFPDSPENTDRMIEEEAEMSAGKAAYFKRIDAVEISPPDDVMASWNPQSNAVWLIEQVPERDLGNDVAFFAAAIGDAIRVFDPEKAERLASHGATLKAGSDAARMIATAAGLEVLYLTDADDEAGRPSQSILGNFSLDGRLEEGLVLRRAAFLHVAAGMDLADCLTSAVSDLRLVQAARAGIAETGNSDLVWSQLNAIFNEVFYRDCKAPLDSYRVANNVYEPAF